MSSKTKNRSSSPPIGFESKSVLSFRNTPPSLFLDFLPSIAPKFPMLPFALTRDRKRKRKAELGACFISSSTIHTHTLRTEREECRGMVTLRQIE